MADRVPTLPRRHVAALALLFVLTLPAVTTRFYASDEVQFYAWLRSAAFDRDADFDNEYRYFYDTGVARTDGFRLTFLEETNEAGRRRNFTPIGTALLWSPFFAIGHAAARVTGAPADGFSQPYVTAVTIGSAFYGFLALGLSAAVSRRVVGDGTFSAASVWLGTPLVFYMYVAPGFSHAASAFAVSLFLWTWLVIRERWTAGGAAALGAAAALMAMVREQDAFFAIGPAVDVVRTVWRAPVAAPEGPAGAPVARQTLMRAGLAGLAASLALYAPQLVAYDALNGHPGPTTDVSRKMSWSSPHALQVLWSPEHGLFFWTPLAFVAVLGLCWLAAGRVRTAGPDARWIGAVALVMFVAQVYVSGSVESWTVAGAFGQRRFVALTPLFVLGLAAIVVTTSTARRAVRFVLPVAAVLLIWWNVGLMAQFGLHRMDRQRLTLAANARRTFLELPRELPSLALRYLSDRESFFGRPRQD